MMDGKKRSQSFVTTRPIANMIVDRDVEIPMDDGIIIRADIFRPEGDGRYPVIMTLGPYGKGVPYRVGFKPQWDWLTSTYPDILPGSSREYMNWETVDPEIWVPWGYICIRVDSRGAGRSQGYLDIFSPREIQDYYQAIEWAAMQSWSTGKIGLNGISYYAIAQWLVASLQPPHLTAIIPWEGAADFYRDWARHGGIESNGFLQAWYPKQVIAVQHGNPKAVHDPWLDQIASGPAAELITETELQSNRSDPIKEILRRPLDCEWYRSRSVQWDKVIVPFLSAANWAGFGLHPRGNFEAFTQAASTQKWLECHPGRHEEWFYLERGMALQRRFLDHFLRGEANGWDREPPVLLHVRRPFSEEWEERHEVSWPLPATNWTKIYLDASPGKPELVWSQPAVQAYTSYSAMKEDKLFMGPPLAQETEITGPIAAKFYVASSTRDVDLFVTLQAFSTEGREVEFQGTIDPHTPLAQGWLRASHRKLDLNKSTPYRPYHTHDELQLLEPGEVYALDVEIWPTNIILPKGYRLALRIGGRDFERPTADTNEAWVSKGSGPWLHTLPEDRPQELFAGNVSIFTGERTASYIILPIIEK
jgi:uncharacterized protein